MGTMKERPRYNVVSLRITDEEWEVLQHIKLTSLKSISEIMREAMLLATPQMESFRERHSVAQGES